MANYREPEPQIPYEAEEEELEELKRQARKARRQQEMLKEKRKREIAIVSAFLIFSVAVMILVIVLVRHQRGGQDTGRNTASSSTTEKSTKPGRTKNEERQTSEEQTPESGSSEPEETPESETGSSTEESESEQVLTVSSDEPDPGSYPEPSADFPVAHVPVDVLRNIRVPSWVSEEYISFSDKTRPNVLLNELQNIVIHYVGNAGSSAEGNREYFESLSQQPEAKGASSHYIVGLEGEIIQCIPVYEVAFANYPRNYETISIEVCHPDDSGQFSSTTYWTLVRLAAYLLEETGLNSEHLIRHFDVSGKECPVFYVQHPEAWQQFKDTVKQYMLEHPDIKNEMP